MLHCVWFARTENEPVPSLGWYRRGVRCIRQHTIAATSIVGHTRMQLTIAV